MATKAKKAMLLQVYLYVVMGFSLLFTVANFGRAVWGVVQVSSPQVTISSYEQEKYVKAKKNEKEIILEIEKRRGTHNIFESILWFFLVLPIFIVHAVLAVRFHKKK